MSSRAAESRTGAEAVVDCLVAEGVTSVFGLPGTTIMDLIDAMARHDSMRFVSVRHEQTAGFMADGHSRIVATPGVCLVSRGPGAANAAIAVQNAFDESIPMVLLVGQVPDGIVERRAFEEMDVVGVFRPMTKWAVEVRQADRIPELLQRAVRTATSGRPGPVVVSLPMDVLQAQTAAAPIPPATSWPAAPHPAALERVAEIARASTSTVLILGGGAHRVPFENLASLAECLGAAVATTWLRKNVFPNDHSHFVGSLGYGAHPETEELVRDADLIIAVGCRFSEFTTKRWTLLPDRVPLVHVDIDPAEIGRVYQSTVGIVSDAAAFAQAMLATAGDLRAEVSARARSEAVAAGRATYVATQPVPPGQTSDGEVPSSALVQELRRLSARADLVLVQDVHSFGPWVQRYLDVTAPHTYFGAAGGAMAWGFPAAMGMALARPDSTVLALCGDGSFWMVAQDFETCVREGIRVVVVIVNNFAYGNTRDRQRFSHEERYSGVFLQNPDFADFARLLGGHGERVTDSTDLSDAIDRAIASGRPAIVDVVQGSFEGLPPGLEPLRAR